MAANKFATMLHRNTNRITLILVYALLEWILIILLLLNSLFSYLIIKFADYFGLKRPCLWCTRLDHIFEPSKFKNSYRDLVCDDHANEISKLGYCSNHRKLAESQDMCEDCLSSDCCDLSKKLGFFPWMKKQVGLIQDSGDNKVMENGEESFKCSCCGVMLEKKWNFPYLLIKPSWEVLDFPQKGNFVAEAGEDGNTSDGIRSDSVAETQEDEQKIEENKRVEIIPDGDDVEKEEDFSGFISSFDCNQMGANEDDVVIEKDQVLMKEEEEEGELNVSMDDGQVAFSKEKKSPEIQPWHLEFYIEGDDCHLIPVELMESAAVVERRRIYNFREEDHGVSGDGDVILDFDLNPETPVENRCSSGEKVTLLSAHDSKDDSIAFEFGMMEPIEEDEHAEEEDEDESRVAGAGMVESNEKDEEGSRKHAGEEDEGEKTAEVVQMVESNEEVSSSKHAGEEEVEDETRVAVVETMASNEEEESSSIHAGEEDEDETSVAASNDKEESISKHAGEEDEDETRVAVVKAMASNEEESSSKHAGEEDEAETCVAVVEAMASNEKEESISTHGGEEDLIVEVEEVATTQATQTPMNEADDVQGNAATGEGEMDIDVNQVSDEQNDESEAEVSIGTDIPDHEPIEDLQLQNLYEYTQEEPSTSFAHLHADDDHGSDTAEEETIQFRTMTVETCDQAIKNHHLSLSSELNDIEEDKVPDTPTSIDSLHLLHKKLLLLDRRESQTDDSLDGSVYSDIEGSDGVLTVEKLKSALKTERKALNALYSELEEERSASAVAANQTMAMINRLQEEKAAMQMEALQYQRMMEEQSEYDQEALQLLNELMIKREKEKAELEKELEIYRRKVQEYEARERMIMLRRRKDDSTRSATSASCSNAEDSDGLSVDLNHEPKEEDSFINHLEDSNQNTPADAVLYLEESLASFEEERLSILEQLKVLEEKLVSLNDEEEQHFESVEYNLYEENGNGFHESSDFIYEMNGVSNGHVKGVNGKHHQEKKLMAANAKRLLPLFDAADAEIEDGILNGHENGFDFVALQHSSPANSELQSKKLAIEEEVDHVYERLQALEADREFLKHCISSLKKGDKGVYLLQEILQHLRDLRSVELRVRNIGEATI
ncbi:hypothetical protein COLO4_13096 [Corchorus olitorius]|uniref:GTD-binding domain-containing protein n=1 Tax=Corchorus olitorius TaxID=93759 RepID=A0A1R3JY51_9ROSI|nr:hypothetical protein COLO4_13096 [Corchorus olitorius]